jgi:hypothetical protein
MKAGCEIAPPIKFEVALMSIVQGLYPTFIISNLRHHSTALRAGYTQCPCKTHMTTGAADTTYTGSVQS